MSAPTTGIGRHTVGEFYGAKHLDDPGVCESAMRRAISESGASLVDLTVHEFSPYGVTAVAVIKESHVAIHTWPEHSYAAVDCFTCGNSVDIDTMFEVLRDVFEPERVDVQLLERGRRVGLPVQFEEAEPGAPSAVRYDMKKLLEQRTTAYQDLVLFESTDEKLGTVMALDGIVQMTDLDTYVYHEVLAQPALFAHPAPRDVAVVGGGDVHLVAEVLKHDTIERVWLLELDQEVIDISRKYYPLAAAALDDPRVSVVAGDAWDSLRERSGELDIVLIDLTDPIGPAQRLFSQEFYELCHEVLRDEGFCVAQTESIHFHPEVVRGCYNAMSSVFAHSDLLWGAIATYPGAWWTFTLGSKSLNPREVRHRQEIETKLYDADAHEWFFIPETIRHKLLG